MMKNSKLLKENAFRSLIRREIKKILEADEAEVTPEPEKEKEEEEGMGEELQGAVDSFVRRLREIGDVDANMIEIVSTIVEAFADSSEQKLNILRGVKTNIIR
jgi:hypothetical protein